MKFHVKYVKVRNRGALGKEYTVLMKRTIAAGLVLLTLLCMVTVLATGSTTDPLITKSYLEGTYAAALKRDIENTLSGAAAASIHKLEQIYMNYEGYIFAPRFTSLSLDPREAVIMTSGTSFILTSGSAVLQVTSGTVINISTGSAVSSGSQIVRNQRYFCTENTSASITASTASSGLIDGYYNTDSDGTLPPVTDLPFDDVRETDWFFNAVGFVYANDLFRGTSETAFSPGMAMTRGMFVTVLHRLDGSPAAGSGGQFSDVRDPAQYFYNAVTWASANKIVEGYLDGTFKPNDSITREQMAVMIHRYASYKDRNMSSSSAAFDAFEDRNSVSPYATQAMRWAVSWEVIRGSNNRMLPLNTATRAEVAQIIVNYCDAFE